MNELYSFKKRFEELKIKSLKKKSFKDKLGGYKDFCIVWTIEVWKKWNQIYFISTRFHTKVIDFLGEMTTKLWFLGFSGVNNEISIESYLKFKEKVENFIKDYDLKEYWFEKEEKEFEFSFEKEFNEVSKFEKLNIEKKEINLSFQGEYTETVLSNYFSSFWIDNILSQKRNELNKEITLKFFEYYYENIRYIDILITKKFDLIIFKIPLDKKEYLEFIKNNWYDEQDLYISQNFLEKLIFKKDINKFLFSDKIISSYLTEKKEIKKEISYFDNEFFITDENDKFLINFQNGIIMTPFDDIKKQEINGNKFEDIASCKNNHYYKD